MKILQINTVCGSGSTGKIAVDLANVLKANGHECLICYGRGEAKGWGNTYRIGTDWSVKFHGLTTRLFDKHGLSSKNATIKLIEKIKQFSPDVIHLHNIHGYYINYEILFSFLQEYNRPVVWTLHDCWAFTGHCAHFDFVGCNKWKTQCERCPQKQVYPASFMRDNSKDNFLRKRAAFTSLNNLTIITPSNWLKNLVGQSFLSKYPVFTINNGIDLTIFKPTKSDFREKYNLEDCKIFLGVANVWTERKGLDDFIKMSTLLKSNEKIVLIGLTKKQIISLPNNIIGITRTENQQELAGIYTTADVFVNPTYEDNFPTTNLESLACGIPVVTYNTGGSVESIFEGNGAIVKQGDAKMLYNTVSAFKKNNLTTSSCLSSSTKYDKADRYLNYFNLYVKVIEGKERTNEIIDNCASIQC